MARPVHARMPVIVAPADPAAWLDPRTPPADLHALLRPYPAEAMPVGRHVGNPRNAEPECLAA